jgi:hypothetical protein
LNGIAQVQSPQRVGSKEALALCIKHWTVLGTNGFLVRKQRPLAARSRWVTDYQAKLGNKPKTKTWGVRPNKSEKRLAWKSHDWIYLAH